jgi:hypothetical protein
MNYPAANNAVSTGCRITLNLQENVLHNRIGDDMITTIVTMPLPGSIAGEGLI